MAGLVIVVKSFDERYHYGIALGPLAVLAVAIKIDDTWSCHIPRNLVEPGLVLKKNILPFSLASFCRMVNPLLF